MTDGFPAWLHLLSSVSLVLAVACAALIVLDEIARPQAMWIMNLVWPLTALFGSVLWLAFYAAWGRGAVRDSAVHSGERPDEKQGGSHAAMHGKPRPRSHHQTDGAKTPFAVSVAKGSSHCGAGCTLGDIIVEWSVFALPGIAVAFGYGSLFAEKTFAVWIPDYIVAFLIGIVFQYFTIAPMRDLSVGDGIRAAVKADFASITAWQVGMYGAMAAIQFLWFQPRYGHVAPVDSAEFWFAMQLAMLAGFVTSYPVNWALIRMGLKEAM